MRRPPLTHLRRLIIALVVPALILIVFAVSTALAVPPQGKTTICHQAANKSVEITVSNSAVPAHMNHGDVLPDDYGDCP